MSLTGNKPYTIEFKQEVVKMALNSAKNYKDLAQEVGIALSTLRRWIREYRAFYQEQDTTETAEQELARLRAENAQLRLERNILKKATAFFAKESH